MRTIMVTAAVAALALLSGCGESTKPAPPVKKTEKSADADAASKKAAPEGSTMEGSSTESSAEAPGETQAPGTSDATSVAPREVSPEDQVANTFGSPEHSMMLPKDWTAAAKPANNIRIFTAAVPKYEDDEKGAEFTISKAMGGWDANVKRYKGFFGGDAGLKKNEELKTAGGVKVNYALFKGTYAAPSFPGMGGGGTFNDYAMGVAMLTAGDGTYFIKLLGPRHTVEWQETAFLEALKSFK